MRRSHEQRKPAHCRYCFTKRFALMALGAGIALVIASPWVPDNPVDEAEEARVMRMIATKIGRIEDEQVVEGLVAKSIVDKRRATAHSMAAWGIILGVAGLLVAEVLARTTKWPCENEGT